MALGEPGIPQANTKKQSRKTAAGIVLEPRIGKLTGRNNFKRFRKKAYGGQQNGGCHDRSYPEIRGRRKLNGGVKLKSFNVVQGEVRP